jgi:hypothetical protein
LKERRGGVEVYMPLFYEKAIARQNDYFTNDDKRLDEVSLKDRKEGSPTLS